MSNETVEQRSMFERLGLAPSALSVASADVSDEELLFGQGTPYTQWIQIMLFGMRRQKIEGVQAKEPMETWHGVWQGRQGLMPRSLRGRAALADSLRCQVLDNGLAFCDLATGEMTRLPGYQGSWVLVEPATGSKALLLAFVAIDQTKGAYAKPPKGQRVAYHVRSGGVEVERARATYPELRGMELQPALIETAEGSAAAMLEAAPHSAADTVKLHEASGKRARK